MADARAPTRASRKWSGLPLRPRDGDVVIVDAGHQEIHEGRRVTRGGVGNDLVAHPQQLLSRIEIAGRKKVVGRRAVVPEGKSVGDYILDKSSLRA